MTPSFQQPTVEMSPIFSTVRRPLRYLAISPGTNMRDWPGSAAEETSTEPRTRDAVNSLFPGSEVTSKRVPRTLTFPAQVLTKKGFASSFATSRRTSPSLTLMSLLFIEKTTGTSTSVPEFIQRCVPSARTMSILSPAGTLMVSYSDASLSISARLPQNAAPTATAATAAARRTAIPALFQKGLA